MEDETLLKKHLPKNKWKEASEKLNQGYPLQYLIGNVDFYGYIINVLEGVLIPRFETEYLVEKLIKLINKYFINKDIKIADLGTGSGAIAVALSKELNVTVDAYDISEIALKLAKENCDINKAKISFYKQDITKDLGREYDIIVSNPPYISKEDTIDKKVYDYEPHLALFAENKGLYFYEKILENSKNSLNKKFIIAFEIGASQGEDIKSISRKYHPHAKIIIEKDLTGKDRYIFIISE